MYVVCRSQYSRRSMGTPAYGAVIFDFFGTLTTAMTRGPAHDRAALALGCDPVAFADVLDRTYPLRASGRYGDLPTTLRRIARQLGRSPSPGQVAAAVGLKVQALQEGISLRPDAFRTLWTIQEAGLLTGLVSDCTQELPALVADLPIAPLLDTTVYSVQMGVTKPDPILFLTASRRLGVHPRQCLYVGDGGGRELSGARAVGMTAVRLAAPDLAGHLVFDREPDWGGASVPKLESVVDLALVSPAPRDVPSDQAPSGRYSPHGRAHPTGTGRR
jgi:putative hydrolase of the HAD superfamily